jgi:hypothetical protein
MNMEQWWNDIFAGETEVLGENLPSATLSTTNPTGIEPGANPGLRGERPATNRLSHGTARIRLLVWKYSVCFHSFIKEYNNMENRQNGCQHLLFKGGLRKVHRLSCRIVAFWVMTPCSSVGGCQRFVVTYRLHLQDRIPYMSFLLTAFLCVLEVRIRNCLCIAVGSTGFGHKSIPARNQTLYNLINLLFMSTRWAGPIVRPPDDMESHGGMIMTGGTEDLPPHISHGLTPDANSYLRGGRSATNCLSHGTAEHYQIQPSFPLEIVIYVCLVLTTSWTGDHRAQS